MKHPMKCWGYRKDPISLTHKLKLQLQSSLLSEEIFDKAFVNFQDICSCIQAAEVKASSSFYTGASFCRDFSQFPSSLQFSSNLHLSHHFCLVPSQSVFLLWNLNGVTFPCKSSILLDVLVCLFSNRCSPNS